MNDHHIRNSCRLCSSPALTPLLTLPDTPLANSYARTAEEGMAQERFPLRLVGCDACGHVQLPVEVDPRRLFPQDYPYASGTSPVFRAHLKDLAMQLGAMFVRKDPTSTPRAKVLDIACNDGHLVACLRGAGHLSAYGIDPCCPEEFGVRGFFTEGWARGQKEQVQCVTALNVFAHVPDLDDFTRGVKALLEPGGLFVVEVAYLPDMVARGIWDTIYHEHTAFHHLSPIVRFFRKHGMTMVDAHRIDTQGGSVRIFVRNHEGRHEGGDDGSTHQSERLQALLDEESRSALWNGIKRIGAGEAGWGVRRARDLIKAAAQRGGGKVAVYGAPAKLCTLLHGTDTCDLVSEVYDDNPLKQGRFVPGTRIAIRPVAEMYERRPRVVLIASWNFADDVKRRHAELGCEWVVPFGGEK